MSSTIMGGSYNWHHSYAPPEPSSSSRLLRCVKGTVGLACCFAVQFLISAAHYASYSRIGDLVDRVEKVSNTLDYYLDEPFLYGWAHVETGKAALQLNYDNMTSEQRQEILPILQEKNLAQYVDHIKINK